MHSYTLNPRTIDIAGMIQTRLDSGSDYFSALSALSDELDLGIATLDECYAAICETRFPDLPSAEYDEDSETWIDTLPSDEFGSVSVGTILFVIAALLAVAYALTL